ncbi:group II intron reverse transcriptase/maturase [Chitinophaga oryziterrae]|uniref:Group II intron reverse transcriptase/maturase n=1 Tax=Chitinophaga oryziterrae TaxID=1031224 RepID=A0A6N8JDG4_9BACT|nr:group II intron reverse transcriptase/maturase [Chitinophaga oryziterrae]MVT43327.1 group II intron reverse transcriptase/maturase [Chitinophaga oryziterrae]
MKEVLTVEMQIAARVRKYPGEALTNLHEFIDVGLLNACFDSLNKKGASGVDAEKWIDYHQQRNERIPQLLSAFKSGTYRAPNIRRVFIPKGDGKLRPLGLPTVEDKLLQTSVSRILTPIYEEIFYQHSYGFRPGKSQHQALEALSREVSLNRKRYIIDADMQNYFGSINHQYLREFLDLKIKDGVIRKMIDKWLKAGILENRQVIYPTEGTPQGGSISPLISNVFLHYVLDAWFKEQIQPLLKGSSFIIRFADDFLLGFTNREDALRVMEVLPKRLGKFGLTLHPEKTRLIDLDEEKGKDNHPKKTFDFLGFTHYMSKSRKGNLILKRKTSSKKLNLALMRLSDWIKFYRHKLPITELITELNQKLRGHYAYYGITFNSRRLNAYFMQTKRLLHKWLNHRGGKRVWTWDKIMKLTTEWIPLVQPRIYHSYLLAKP